MASSGKLGELLVAKGLITAAQLKEAAEHRTATRGRLVSSLVALGHVNENVLVTFLSKQYGIPAVSIDDARIPDELIRTVPISLCEKHMLVPLSLEGNQLTIAVCDPTNVSAVDDVRFLSNRDVNVVLATESSIRALLERAYTSAGGQIDPNAAPDLGDDLKFNEGGVTRINITDAAAKAQEEEARGGENVVRTLNKILLEAIRRRVSDIHIEPFDQFLRVRFRIDGALHEVMRLPPQMKAPMPARVKVMAQLDISEKRLPQDGRIQVKTNDRKIDIRVSILPVIFGEKVVMRILDQGSSTPDLFKIGFEEAQLELFKKAAQQPYGMILVTGPTGSGKSTTLYAALNELNTPDVNISTVEDPVEYNMGGVNQTQMKEGIGLNFAAALRSLLRQDPDIVMVGEIRDTETAEIAIKAALTGHMVFSTLHTNDAPSTVSRLIHMGIEPFLITAALTLVQAQRLVRIICDKCRRPDPKVTREMLIEAEVPESWLDTIQPMRGVGCDRCGGTGYKGRRGIFEVMYMTERLRELIIKGANADQLRAAALADGMITLRQSALLKLYRGETTLEEVLNNSRPDGDIK
jgi:type IV pilus assembly protein PilB